MEESSMDETDPKLENEGNGNSKPPVTKEISRNFFAGILVFIPLIFLLLIIRFFVETVLMIGTNILGITKSFEMTAIVAVITIVFITYAGYKFRKREQWLLNYLETLIISIPFLGSWYKIMKDLISSFSGAGQVEGKYLGVAKVPVGNGYVIAFVTKRQKIKEKVHVTLFMPTSPNPTSGIVLFFEEEQIEYLPMTAEKAFTKIISLGVRE